ncbi:MAG: triose-phosphate isomerase, partial [Pseudomonadota bacterium]
MRYPPCMARIPLVVGNWKLFNTVAESLSLVRELRERLAGKIGSGGSSSGCCCCAGAGTGAGAGEAAGSGVQVEIGIAPVFTALYPVAKALEGSGIRLAAQDCFWENQGAWTGEVSAPLLRDVGCSYVIVGHSERRQHFGEQDDAVGRKAKAVLDAGLSPIICIGETETERDAGKTFDRLDEQLRGALAGIVASQAPRVVIAY